MRKAIFYLPLIVAGLIFLPACENEDEGSDETADLTLAINGLPMLDDFHSYEGWIMVNGTPVSTGKFSVDETGSLDQNTFTVNADDLAAANKFIVTIEPDPDNSPDATDIHIIAGSFIGNSASLSIGNESAIGTTFNTVVGKYILATPTDGEETNELSGIWWLVPGNNPSPSLELPTLPDGWMYEGWVEINGTPVSTGKFSEVDQKDMASPYSAALEGPAFPGEDFLRNAPAGLTFPTNLAGERAIISVEPNPDNSNEPFDIKPLIGAIPLDAIDHNLYNMTNNSGSISIAGEATR